MKHKVVLLTIMICVFAFAGSGRGYGFLMLEEPLSAKSVSMGSVGTALGGNGFSYYNPAAPFFSAHPYVSIEFGRMPGGVSKGGFESAFISSNWFTALGFYSSSLDFETRDERGFGSKASGSTTIGEIGAGFVRESFAAGVSALMAQERIWIANTYNAYTLSAGLGYKLFDGKLNLGAAGFHGFSKAESKGFDDNAFVKHDGLVPRFARAGAAWTDTVKTFPFTAAADIVYRDEDKTISVPVGAEVWVLPCIALRAGKRFGWESEIFSLGIGFNIDQISFDAAFVPSVFVDDYELKWSMGLSYSMGGKRKKTEPPKVSSYEVFEPVKVTPPDEVTETPQEEVEPDEQETVNIDELLDDEAAEVTHEEAELDEQESVNIDEIIDTDDKEPHESELDKQESAIIDSTDDED
jgi:hypothetical protein